jgi:hypothetical protein
MSEVQKAAGLQLDVKRLQTEIARLEGVYSQSEDEVARIDVALREAGLDPAAPDLEAELRRAMADVLSETALITEQIADVRRKAGI